MKFIRKIENSISITTGSEGRSEQVRWEIKEFGNISSVDDVKNACLKIAGTLRHGEEIFLILSSQDEEGLEKNTDICGSKGINGKKCHSILKDEVCAPVRSFFTSKVSLPTGYIGFGHLTICVDESQREEIFAGTKETPFSFRISTDSSNWAPD